MQIIARLNVSQTTGTHTFDLEDLGLYEEQWQQMSEVERKEAVHNAVIDLLEQPYWVLDTFTTED